MAAAGGAGESSWPNPTLNRSTSVSTRRHRRRIESEEKAKVVAAVFYGTKLNDSLIISQQGCFEQHFW